jgi:hypothetical protein
MMGHKAIEPKLYLSFSLDAAVPANHLVRRLASVVDFHFVHGLVRRQYSHTGQPSVDPIVLFKLWLLITGARPHRPPGAPGTTRTGIDRSQGHWKDYPPRLSASFGGAGRQKAI